jgi:hypothetical protein
LPVASAGRPADIRHAGRCSPGAGNKSADRDSFEYGEWIAFHEDAVFEGARLGLIGIADDVVRAAAFQLQPISLQEKCFPFSCSGKRSAAAAQQL